MSRTSKDMSLPSEVLKIIFENLVEKEYLKTCLLMQVVEFCSARVF